MKRIIEIKFYNTYTHSSETLVRTCNSLADAMLWIQCFLETRIELEMYKPVKIKTYVI